jgi:tubulin-specific chaperone A
MAPPSPLVIATGSVQRLVKEETSYHKELKNQEARLEKLVNSTEENENKEYQLKQEVYRPSSYLTYPIFFTIGVKGWLS